MMTPFNPTPVKHFDENAKARIAFVKALPRTARIHISGVCGTGTGSILSLLKILGFYVSGSDKAFYPPMGDVVRSTADKIYEGFSKDNLADRPDLVIIGNALSRNNPEVEEVLEREIPFCSMPELLSALLIGDREYCPTSIVLSGTHGKTTTSSLVASILKSAGREPAYFIGGVPTGDLLQGSIQPQKEITPIRQRVCVLEGDEYDSAFFAKYSKFHCYRPDILVITNIDFDHADIFSSVEDIEKEFLGLLNEMPEGSHVIAYYDHGRVRNLIKSYLTSKEAPVNVIWYGESEGADYQITSREVVSKLSEVEQRIEVKSKLGTDSYSFNLSGAHNAQNVLSSIIACSLVGLSKDEIQAGLNAFHPIKRRQQLISNENGILVFEDFAHHPKEVTVTLAGLREAYKPNRLIAVFEPRSNTSRKDFFKDDYLNALMTADVVILRDLDQNTTVYSGVSPEAKLLSVNSLSVSLIDNGKESYCIKDIKEIYTKVNKIAKSGDLVVLMSNGDFGGLPGMFS